MALELEAAQWSHRAIVAGDKAARNPDDARQKLGGPGSSGSANMLKSYGNGAALT